MWLSQAFMETPAICKRKRINLCNVKNQLHEAVQECSHVTAKLHLQVSKYRS